MESDKDEDYRLGYVAFSRAKKVLIICCLEKIDLNQLESGCFDIHSENSQ